MKDILSVKEVGELFGLTIQTMHYYDKIGLFKPEYRDNSNGYRQYTFSQVYQLATIRYLRRFGVPLKEIQEYQNAKHPDNTLRILRERSEILHNQLRELIDIDNAIMRKVSFIEQAMPHIDLDEIAVRERKERRYIPIGTEENLYLDESFYLYPTIAFYEDDLKHFGAYLYDMPEEDLPKNIPIKIIPAGRYLVGYHKGPYELVTERFKEMRKAFPQYVLSETTVNYNIIDQFVERDVNEYIVCIEMAILGERNNIL